MRRKGSVGASSAASGSSPRKLVEPPIDRRRCRMRGASAGCRAWRGVLQQVGEMGRIRLGLEEFVERRAIRWRSPGAPARGRRLEPVRCRGGDRCGCRRREAVEEVEGIAVDWACAAGRCARPAARDSAMSARSRYSPMSTWSPSCRPTASPGSTTSSLTSTLLTFDTTLIEKALSRKRIFGVLARDVTIRIRQDQLARRAAPDAASRRCRTPRECSADRRAAGSSGCGSSAASVHQDSGKSLSTECAALSFPRSAAPPVQILQSPASFATGWTGPQHHPCPAAWPSRACCCA